MSVPVANRSGVADASRHTKIPTARTYNTHSAQVLKQKSKFFRTFGNPKEFDKDVYSHTQILLCMGSQNTPGSSFRTSNLYFLLHVCYLGVVLAPLWLVPCLRSIICISSL